MGMNPNAVMTITQKIERFKKGTFQRKSSAKSEADQRTQPFFKAIEHQDEASQAPKDSNDEDRHEVDLRDLPPLTPIDR